MAKEKKKDPEKIKLDYPNLKHPSSDDVIRKLNEFDKKLNLSKLDEDNENNKNIMINDEKKEEIKENNYNNIKNIDQTGFFIDDKLSASAFFKKVKVYKLNFIIFIYLFW